MNEAVERLEFTPEEIGRYGCENAEGLWLTTVAYFVKKGSGLVDWVDYVGANYALGWSGLKGKVPLEVLRVAVLNWISCGAKLISSSGDEQRAEAVMEFPKFDPQEEYQISYQDTHTVNRVFIHIARNVGLNFEYHSEGPRFKIVFYK
jgi:hypothetical protein